MAFHGGNIYTYKDKEVLDYSSNINPLGVPDSFRKAVIEQMDCFTQYPEIEYTDIKQTIADHIGVTREQIVVGNGAVEIIFGAIAMKGYRKMITLSPTFAEYREAAEKADIAWEEWDVFEQDYQRINLDRLLQKVDVPSIVVICNPNNPTGTLTETKELVEFAHALQKKESILIVDEAFIEFTDAYPKSSMTAYIHELSNVFIVRAATKFYGMPGIRLGYGISANKKFLRQIEKDQLPWRINTAAVLAAKTVFEDQGYIQQSRKWIKEERRGLYKALTEIEGLKVYPSEANFFLVEVQKYNLDAWKLRDALIEKNILIRTPEGFSSLSSKHVRFAIKDRISNEKLIRALKEVMR